MIRTVWHTFNPITYNLLHIGLVWDKNTCIESKKISDGTCDICSFLGDILCAYFTFAGFDENRQCG